MSWNIEAYRTETTEMALVVHRLGGRCSTSSVGPKRSSGGEKNAKKNIHDIYMSKYTHIYHIMIYVL